MGSDLRLAPLAVNRGRPNSTYSGLWTGGESPRMIGFGEPQDSTGREDVVSERIFLNKTMHA